MKVSNIAILLGVGILFFFFWYLSAGSGEHTANPVLAATLDGSLTRGEAFKQLKAKYDGMPINDGDGVKWVGSAYHGHVEHVAVAALAQIRVGEVMGITRLDDSVVRVEFNVTTEATEAGEKLDTLARQKVAATISRCSNDCDAVFTTAQRYYFWEVGQRIPPVAAKFRKYDDGWRLVK